MQPRISLITLGVADLARARRFYGAGLGWRESRASNEQIAFYHTGGVVLALYPRALLAEDAKQAAGVPGFGGFTLAHNVPAREDVDATLAEAVASGATLAKAAEDAFWGGRSGYFLDPDGHAWEVAWNPHFPLGADGAVQLPE